VPGREAWRHFSTWFAIAGRCGARETAKLLRSEDIPLPSVSSFATVPAIVRKLPSLAVLWCAVALAGCAAHPGQGDSQAEQARAGATADQASPSRINRSSRALLLPQPAPDCEFRGADPRSVDPAVFARLKLDYERQCYQRAEKVARERLRLLQASRLCEIEPGRLSLIR
jgi:hypothetical protein